MSMKYGVMHNTTEVNPLLMVDGRQGYKITIKRSQLNFYMETLEGDRKNCICVFITKLPSLHQNKSVALQLYWSRGFQHPQSYVKMGRNPH